MERTHHAANGHRHRQHHRNLRPRRRRLCLHDHVQRIQPSGPGWSNHWGCPEELAYTFDHVDDDPPTSFTDRIGQDDVGNNATYSVPVMLYNEIPDPVFTVNRSSTASEALVTLDECNRGPGGQRFTATFTSSLDGVLQVGSELIWEGHLSRGVHTITMEVSTTEPNTPTKANPTPSCSRLTTPSPSQSLLHHRPKPSTAPN